MGIRIGTNITALNAQRQMGLTRVNQDKALERLASGNRINRSGDDAAGLAISENLRAQIRGIRQAKRNASDGMSMIQVSEGALNEVSNILIRLRELAVQAASDTIGDNERHFSNREFQSLKQEIDRISNAANFNGTPLLNGKAGALEFQVGTRNDATLDRITYNSDSANATVEALKIGGENLTSKLGAQTSLSVIDGALNHVNSIRADMGALQNRLMSTMNNLAISDENMSAAQSRIRDADMAEEVSEMTKNNILMQSGISVLSQANQTNQAALKLLQ